MSAERDMGLRTWALAWTDARLNPGGQPTPAAAEQAARDAGHPVSEALRQVAIALESCDPLDVPWGHDLWEVQRALYERADALAPTAAIRTSAALSCLWSAPSPLDDPTRHAGHLEEARRWAQAAVEMNPEEAHAHAVLGRVLYADDDAPVDAALASFDEAVRLDPSDVWSRLYRAYALDDLGRWQEAASAYDTVHPDAFDTVRAWRGLAARWRRAVCLVRMADARGSDALERILEELAEALDSDEGPLHPWFDAVVPEDVVPDDLRDRLPGAAQRGDAIQATFERSLGVGGLTREPGR